MGKRIVSTLLLWTVVLLCIRYLGAVGGVWLVTAIAVLTLREFYALVHRIGVDPFDRFGTLLGGLIVLAPLYIEPHFNPPMIGALGLVALSVIVFSVRILGEREAHSRVETLAWTLFGVLYVPFMLHFLVRIILLKSPHEFTGLTLCLWLIAVSKFCDVGALLSGMAFGRTKMAPNISPKKTWEGAIGGVLISAAIGAGISHFWADYLPGTFTPLLAAGVAVPIAVLAIVSDLIESIIKRRADAKDAGQTIPGIGGVFDLSDSLILTAPVGYIVFNLL
jgi:phosphatidate cytidylyltransferase